MQIVWENSRSQQRRTSENKRKKSRIDSVVKWEDKGERRRVLYDEKENYQINGKKRNCENDWSVGVRKKKSRIKYK